MARRLVLLLLCISTTARAGETPGVRPVTPAAAEGRGDATSAGPEEPARSGAPARPAEAAREPEGVEPAVRIAVADLDVSGVEPKAGRVFVESLLAEIRKLRRVSVISMDEVRSMLDLEAQKQLVGCDEEESCLAEIAGALGADILVVGGLAKLNDQSIVGLKRIDQRSARVESQVSRRLAEAGGEEFLAAIGPIVEELFPERPLRDGETRGVAPEMALRLNPPPVPAWAFWSSAGVTGAAAVGTALASAFWLFNQGAYQQSAALSATQLVSGAQLKGQERLVVGSEIAMWSLAGGTVALGLLTGGMAPFVDWHGVGEELEEP